MRRIIEALAAFALMFGVLAGFYPWQMTDARVKARAVRELRLAIGLDASVEGPITFTLLPTPRLIAHAVQLSSSDGMIAASVEQVAADFALLPLIGSRLEFASIVLDRAKLNVELGLALARRSAQSAMEQPRGQTAPPPRRSTRLALRNSAVVLHGVGDADGFAVSAVNMKLDWPYEDAPLSLAGEAKALGQYIALAGFIARPGALRRGEASVATLDITAQSPALSLRFDGALDARAGLQFQGALQGASAGLAALLRPATATGGGARDTARIEAELDASAAGAELAGVRLELAGATLEGALRASVLDAGAPGARFALTGTLASAALALDPLAQFLPQWRDAAGKWNAAPLEAAWLRRSDLDLRVSATSATLGSLSGEDAAFSILVRNGKFNFALQDMRAYGGRARASFSGAFADEKLEAKCDAQFADVSMARLAQDAPGLQRMSGTAQGSVGVTLLGGSIRALAAGLNGGAQLRFANGELQGLDFEQALRRLERKPGSVPAVLAAGATAFDSFDVPAKIANGVAHISEGLLSGPGARASFKGDIDIERQRVSITSVANAVSAGHAPAPAAALTIDITGALGEQLAVAPRLVGPGAP